MRKYWLVIIILFLADRLAKIYVYNNPSFHQKGGFISLYMNRNIAFSLPLASQLLYPAIVAVILILLFFWYTNFKKNTFLIWPFGMIIAGAISNLIDRILYGGVIDFINVPYFTVLNMADIYISLAAFYLVISELPGQKVDKEGNRI